MNKLAWWPLLAVVGFDLLFSIISFFYYGQILNLIDCYFIALMFGASYFIYKLTENKNDYKAQDIIISLSLFVFTIAFRFSDLTTLSIWIDEYAQYQNAVLLNGVKSIAKSATIDQHPPLDYYIMAGFTAIFGLGEKTLRFPSLFYSASYIGAFYLLLRGLRFNYLFSLLGVFILMLDLPLKYFSYEARPNAHGVCFSILFLFVCSYYFRKVEASSTRNYLPVLAISTIFLLSLGLQPIFFLIAFLLAFLFIQKRVLAINIVAALLLFVPFVCIIYVTAAELNQFHVERVDFFKNMIMSISWDSFYLEFLRSYRLKWNAYVITLIPAFFALFFYRKELAERPLLKAILFSSIIFPPTFYVFFKAIINWELMVKYYMVYTPILIIASILGFEYIHSSMSKLNKHFAKLVTLVGLVYFVFYSIEHSERYKKYETTNWREIYKQIEVSQGDTLTYYLPLIVTSIEENDYCIHFGRKIYMPERDKSFVEYRMQEDLKSCFLNFEDIDKPERDRIILITPHYWTDKNYDLTSLSLPSGVTLHHFDGFTFVEILKTNNQSAELGVVNFFKSFIDRYSSESFSHMMISSLLARAILYHSSEEANYYLNKLKGLNVHSDIARVRLNLLIKGFEHRMSLVF